MTYSIPNTSKDLDVSTLKTLLNIIFSKIKKKQLKTRSYLRIGVNVISENIFFSIMQILNFGLHQGILPNSLKIESITFIFKKVEEQSLKNYRPISVLISFSMALERIMYDGMHT